MQTDSSPINYGPPPPVYSAQPAYGEKSSNAPYPVAGGQPYPPAGGQPYPQPMGQTYPVQGGPPYQQAGGQPYPQPGGQPYPLVGGQPYQQAVGQPYSPPQQHTTTTVIMQQPTVVMHAGAFRESPVNMVCPSCQATITTGLTYEAGTCAWLACLGLFFIGCDLGCCLIPFCVDGCKDVHHRCPNCNRTVGRYNRL